MPSDAWVDTTELSGEKKKEQSPDTVMEEPTEPAPGPVIAQAGQQDAEKDRLEPKEDTTPKEETRRVVLVTMEPEESTEVIVEPPEQEPEKSTEDREANRTSRKGKGIGDGETGIRSSEGSSRARDPREAFCRDRESSGGNVRAGSDVSNESLVELASSTRSERRGEANQKSSQAASAGIELQAFSKQFERDHQCDGRGLWRRKTQSREDRSGEC